MSMESIIFFVLALFVWGLSAVARWFQEQMGRNSTDGIEFEPIDWSSNLESELPPVPLEPPIAPQQEQLHPSPPVRREMFVKKEPIKRFGLGRPQTLRQGIILMTVLGPCRALEPSKDSIAF